MRFVPTIAHSLAAHRGCDCWAAAGEAAQDVSKLEAGQGDVEWLSASAAGEILKRTGLVSSRRVRRRAPPRMAQLTVPQHANQVWGLDHRGWTRLGDGSRVEPFMVTDGFSRYLISLAATGNTQYAECRQPLAAKDVDLGHPA